MPSNFPRRLKYTLRSGELPSRPIRLPNCLPCGADGASKGRSYLMAQSLFSALRCLIESPTQGTALIEYSPGSHMDPLSTRCPSSRQAFWNVSPTGIQNGFHWQTQPVIRNTQSQKCTIASKRNYSRASRACATCRLPVEGASVLDGTERFHDTHRAATDEHNVKIGTKLVARAPHHNKCQHMAFPEVGVLAGGTQTDAAVTDDTGRPSWCQEHVSKKREMTIATT